MEGINEEGLIKSIMKMTNEELVKLLQYTPEYYLDEKYKNISLAIQARRDELYPELK